jgi:hypothetical protein
MSHPRLSKTLPNAIADAIPEQNTKVSVASENPKRAGIHNAQKSRGVCAMKMINIAMPRKKSSRGSRTVFPAIWGGEVVKSLLDLRYKNLMFLSAYI